MGGRIAQATRVPLKLACTLETTGTQDIEYLVSVSINIIVKAIALNSNRIAKILGWHTGVWKNVNFLRGTKNIIISQKAYPTASGVWVCVYQVPTAPIIALGKILWCTHCTGQVKYSASKVVPLPVK